MEFAAAKLRREDDHDLVILSAWYVEAIRQMTRKEKRLPELKRLLQRGEAAQPTREQQLAVYQQLSEHYKLPLRVKKE